jgi:hypothetical protein
VTYDRVSVILRRPGMPMHTRIVTDRQTYDGKTVPTARTAPNRPLDD